jgi:hypothetical protein
MNGWGCVAPWGLRRYNYEEERMRKDMEKIELITKIKKNGRDDDAE